MEGSSSKARWLLRKAGMDITGISRFLLGEEMRKGQGDIMGLLGGQYDSEYGFMKGLRGYSQDMW